MDGAGAVLTNNGPKNYPGGLTRFLFSTCLVAGMGGLIFGYDLGISGGVTAMPSFLKKFFPSVYRREALDTSTNQYCTFNDAGLTMFTSSLYLAALIASMFASWVTRRFGRKISMLLGGFVFLAGSALNAFAQNLWMLILGRIFLGVGVGFSNQSVPLYLSEMAPYKYRGALNIIFQLAITIGIFIANFVNYLTPKWDGGEGWRVSLGLAGVPALFVFISAVFLPNTPNSMLEKGQVEEARAMLRRIRGVTDREVEEEFKDMVEASNASKAVKNSFVNIRKLQYRPQLAMSILIPCFQQLTGMNVVMFYAPVLFKSIGFEDNTSLYSAAITGAVNLLATFVSIYLVDRWGRRFLFLQGGVQMLVFQALVAGFIGSKFGTSGVASELPKWFAVAVVIFICMFVAAYAWSWGPLGWLVPSEIYPLEIRSAAQSITVAVNMLFTFLIAQLFLPMLCHLKFGLFIVFAALIIVMSLYIYFMLPETKNIPIEEMNQIWESHWYWRRFMDAAPTPAEQMT